MMYSILTNKKTVAVDTLVNGVNIHTTTKDALITFNGSILAGIESSAAYFTIDAQSSGDIATRYSNGNSSFTRYEAYGLKFVASGTSITYTTNTAGGSALGTLYIYEID